MIEVVLTREDANTDVALLADWLVEDQGEVRRGQPVCLVETSKASVEVEAPDDGTLVHLYPAGADVELGRPIALIAPGAAELASALERRDRRPAARAPGPASGRRTATRKAALLAERLGVDLDAIEKDAGFVTAEDVEAWLAHAGADPGPVAGAGAEPLAGVSTHGVTLPASLAGDPSDGIVEPAFLERLRSDPAAFRALSPEEKRDAYRAHGARIGDGVVLDEGAILVAPRIVVEDGARIGRGGTVRCEEVVAIGALTHFGPSLELTCRRAYVGAGVHAGRSIRIGGGGHRDPWALVAVGDLTFLGDEVFVNPCRPVLIGSEVFLTMRSVLVTHNIGHSVLEGFENRFAPIVLEDRSQVGIGTVVYAGCRVGEGAIVGSGSYVVSDIPPGKLAIGVPARVAGEARRTLPRARQVELGRKLIDDLLELLVARGHPAGPLAGGDLHGLELETETGRSLVLFVESLADPDRLRAEAAETVVLTLEYRGGEPPDGIAILDLLARTLHGQGGILLDSVREFCRKHGIRLDPGPWRYERGLI